MSAEMDQEQEIQQPPMALITAIQKAEIEQSMVTARAFPRSIKRFANAVLDMACLSEAVAESCLYALPRGGKTIEGPSARFAEILASAWGNSRSGARVVAEEAEFVVAEGIFHDLESNTMITMQVKRRITDKDGRRYNSDMIAVTGNAAASIAHRNAVLKGVPKAFWNPAYLAARQTAVGDVKSLANKRADAFVWLQKHHVSAEMALACLGVEAIEDVGLDELAILKGAINSVKSGELTIEVAFAPRQVAKPQAKSPPKPVTDRPKSKGKQEPEPKPAPEAAPTAADPKTPISVEQINQLLAKIDAEGVPPNAFLAKYELGTVQQLPAAWFDRAMAWLDGLSAGKPV